MMAPQIDIKLFSSTTQTLKLEVRDDFQQPVDLTGFTVTMTALSSDLPGASAIWKHTLTLADQNSETGVARYHLTAADTLWRGGSAGIPSKAHYYTVEAAQGSENNVVAWGNLIIFRGKR